MQIEYIPSSFKIPNSVQDLELCFYNQALSGIQMLQLPTALFRAPSMFSGCSKLRDAENIIFPELINYSSLVLNSMFYNCSELEVGPSINLKKSEINSYSEINLEVSKMFYNCNTLKSLTFKISNEFYISNASQMFYNCWNLTLDSAKFNLKNILDGSNIFYNCLNITEVPSSLFAYSAKTANNRNRTFSNAFSECIALSGCIESLTKNITNISYIFYNCKELSNINLVSFFPDYETGTYKMQKMFYNCASLPSLSEEEINNLANKLWNNSNVSFNPTDAFKGSSLSSDTNIPANWRRK